MFVFAFQRNASWVEKMMQIEERPGGTHGAS